jgi:ABC-type Fe3+/spermidine/putrescine transport system ATPase subunit
VALARALVVDPQLLLLDEPLSNLDARLRAEMRLELKNLHAKTGVTAVYVTHDQEEALSLADRIAFLDQGNIVQIGTPRELYASPATVSAARFLGTANVVAGTITNAAGREVTVETGVGILQATTGGNTRVTNGQKVFCLFRPESMQLGESAPNRLTGVVVASMFSGGHEQIHLAHGATPFQASIRTSSPAVAGKTLSFGIDPADILVLAE